MTAVAQLALFADLPAVAAPVDQLYVIRGFYSGSGGHQVDPRGQGNAVTYPNRTRRQICQHYTSPAEFDEMVATGERRHTSKACLDWDYEITVQTTPVAYNPSTGTWDAVLTVGETQ